MNFQNEIILCQISVNTAAKMAKIMAPYSHDDFYFCPRTIILREIKEMNMKILFSSTQINTYGFEILIAEIIFKF